MKLGTRHDFFIFAFGGIAGMCVIPLLAGLVGLSYLVTAKSGKALDPNVSDELLFKSLRERAGWQGVPIDRVEGAWEQRFADYVRLYRVRVSEGEFASLRACLFSSTNQWMKAIEIHDTVRSKLLLRDDDEYGVHNTDLPSWWDVHRLKNLEGVFWDSEYGWGMWFGYDGARGLMFVLHYTT